MVEKAIPGAEEVVVPRADLLVGAVVAVGSTGRVGVEHGLHHRQIEHHEQHGGIDGEGLREVKVVAGIHLVLQHSRSRHLNVK